MRRSVKRAVTWGLGVIVAVPLLLVAFFVAWIAALFKSGVFYTGDGEYRQPGTNNASFQVAFPEIDISTGGTYTYRFTRLAPTSGWLVGVRPQAIGSAATLKLTLTNERGQTVFDELVQLDADAHFATVQGVTREIPID